MPELTENQIADLLALADHCRSLAADLVIIGAIAYQVHFPRENRHTGDIDFAVALDLDEFAELERRLLADKWIRFANREHRWIHEQLGLYHDYRLRRPWSLPKAQPAVPVS